MQRRDQIVVAVLALVVDRRAALHDALQGVGVENLAGLCSAPDFLGERQGRAAVAVGHAQQNRPRLLVQRQSHALGFFGAGEQLFQALLAQRMESQHTRARQKRGIEFEGRVFGGRADQDHRAVLHYRQEAILLGAVEAMDLVDEKQRLAAVRAAKPRALEHLLQVGDAGEDRRNLLEVQGWFRRRAAGRPWFFRCRRPPEDHRAERARTDQARQRAVLAGQMLLADDLAEVFGAQTVGKRRARRRFLGSSGRTGPPSEQRSHHDIGMLLCFFAGHDLAQKPVPTFWDPAHT